ncbi:hypothetical protein AYO21_04540 [Fonsecaea monophora]|uniref:DUF6987 domain-containing protein n=1 Tax=Fonsecaea monophora TaxID=254056 RepID=A0A177FC37_9EURO|nr:hypothetical protein AYO21_04540 [Fonsecaea monophora]KAH0837080.1 putative lea domain protein [Fonsecaea pedrosoi]OAG41160.1 hypothetical protein AYO21_04540 [Fonsecaea monophora]
MPSPAAGRTSNVPETPTKTGKNPASSSTSKLTGEGTPGRKPPKLGTSKATPKKLSESESPKPKPTEDITKPVEEKGKDVEEESQQGISMKDTEEPGGKISQPGDDTGAETSELSEANPEPIPEDDDDEEEGEEEGDTVRGGRDAAKDEGTEGDEEEEEVAEEGDAAEEAEDEAEGKGNGALSGLGKATSGVVGTGKKVAGRVGGAKDSATGAAGKASQGDVQGAADDTVGDAKDTAEDTAQDVQDTAEDTAEGAKETAEEAADAVPKDTGDVPDVKETANGVKGHAEKVADDVEETAEEAADGATEGLPVDLSILKGLKVTETGDIKDKAGNVVGKLDEGDPADLEGYEIGDDGEILDEDGDVVGRASVIPEKAQELAGKATEDADVDGAVNGVHETAEGTQDQAEEAVNGVKDTAEDAVETYLPDLNVLDGLEVQENGDILDKDGNVLGRITEGDPADLVGMTVNADGEILDEDGDAVGRAETLPQPVKQAVEEAAGELPGVEALEGLEVQEDGAIKDQAGNTLGKITEGDPADLVGRTLNAEGEVLDEDGDVIGRAEIVPEAAEAVQEKVDGVQEGAKPEFVQEAFDKVEGLQDQLKPNLTIVEGRKLNKKGTILDDEGEVLAKLVEGDVKACAGKLPNENGEILDKDGKVIGRVEVVQGEAAEEAMKELHPELVEQLEEAQQAAEEAEKQAEEAGDQADVAGKAADAAEGAADTAEEAVDEAKDAAEKIIKPDFAQLEGLKVNKKGQVVNEDGDPIAQLAEGFDLDAVRGKKINENGEILDKDGNVIGRVEFIPEAVEEGIVETIEEAAPEVPETSILEGLKVNKKGLVLNEDGDEIAKLVEGDLAAVAGKKLNDKGEVLDKDGNVIGKVEMIPQEVEEEVEEAAEEIDDGLPPLSILEGLKVNKSGKIVDNNGNVVGELVEGDAKKIWKAGTTCDDQGQFWDNKGHIIGRAKTLPQEDKEEEAEFAGLEGLTVVADGWVEDENGNRVGRIVEGDPKKLVGRAVDEDGDIIDKRGNVVGHAERYEEPEPEPEPEEQKIDLSELKGLTCNKQGNVIGPDGVPIGRLVEGNPKELAGRKIDENGQIWNDQGHVVGRCELIPFNEREAKPEGPFAGLEGLIVVKDGFVEDHEGNVVGQVVEGDWKKLLGRGVDEDGDIIDKYGNVKGHVEPYEVPEEEVVEEDLSSLAGKTVNKQGKVVDEHGTIFGEVAEGEVQRLVGCKVDGKGQIWSNDGRVIGRARLIAGGDDGRAEGPFSNFDSTTIDKDGLVKDASGEIIGRVTEGDIKKLVGRKVDDDGDIVDKNGNVIGHAERWEPEKKEREVSPMSGLRVNKEGEVRDRNGDVIGRLTEGNLLACIGKEVNDNGYVVDQDGNKIGECTLLENIPDEEEVEEGPTPEQLKEEEEREVAKKISNIINQTLEKMEPICKQITELVERADRTPKDELDEEKLVQDVKPLIEEGSRILGECNGAIRGLDPDGHIAANAKAKAASGEASPEEYRVAEGLKELTTQVVKTIDNAKKKIADMPHAKKKLNPLWALLTEPLFQIIAAVGLLLSGVLGLVGKLLNGLGLGGLVSGLLGGLGVDKLLGGLGLGSLAEAMGLGSGKKKK